MGNFTIMNSENIGDDVIARFFERLENEALSLESYNPQNEKSKPESHHLCNTAWDIFIKCNIANITKLLLKIS